MKQELKLIIMAICTIITLPLLTSCGDDDEPTYLYSYWNGLRASVHPHATSVQIDPLGQGDGVVLSPNKSDLEDFESLGLMKLWSMPDCSETDYYIGNVRCQWGWAGFSFDNLTPNTTYYYRVINMATSSKGNDITEYKILYGDIFSFQTTAED